MLSTIVTTWFLSGSIVWSLRHFSNCWMLVAIADEVYVHNDWYRTWTVPLSFGPGLPRYVSWVVGILKCRHPAGVPVLPGGGLGRRTRRRQRHDRHIAALADQAEHVWGGVAPYSYWQRGLDMYTLVQQMVDQQIGRVVAAIPKAVRANTVIMFASDHGEYAGAHGLLAGKIGTAYEEAIRVPLIVTDFTRRFAKQVSKRRTQLASSVDLVPMLVTLGNGGSISWRRGELATYGERLNLVELLAQPERRRTRPHPLRHRRNIP